jgi:NTE family protein
MQNLPHRNGKGENGAPALPGQVVLVLQGGGALGAFQAGVYQALHEAGIEPDWVIGTSIGAINGALIAGNPPVRRLERLHAFWESIEQNACANMPAFFFPDFDPGNMVANLVTMATGIQSFFTPNPMALLGPHAPVGIENAAYYSTAPLRDTLSRLVDFDYINGRHMRLSLGAVNVGSGQMRYFDSRDETLEIQHVMASGALPLAFPAIRIEEDFYWDGGAYSNTPIEAVLDDRARRDSLIFTVDIWNPEGPEPNTLWEASGREKEIRYASRARSHLARQKQIHHLRHVIGELVKAMPADLGKSPEVRELAAWGCRTTMHVVRLAASGLAGEDQMKDIDFTPAGIQARWQAGYADTQRMIELAPWTRPVEPVEGVIIHEAPTSSATPVAAGIDGFGGKTK